MSNHTTNDFFSESVSERRVFINNLLKAAGASLFFTSPLACGAREPAGAGEMTVQDIIDLIIKDITGSPLSSTVDTIKSGKGDQRVTGIVTTMFATVDVINEAARRKANFIIAHEPTFYNHTDDINWVS